MRKSTKKPKAKSRPKLSAVGVTTSVTQPRELPEEWKELPEATHRRIAELSLPPSVSYSEDDEQKAAEALRPGGHSFRTEDVSPAPSLSVEAEEVWNIIPPEFHGEFERRLKLKLDGPHLQPPEPVRQDNRFTPEQYEGRKTSWLSYLEMVGMAAGEAFERASSKFAAVQQPTIPKSMFVKTARPMLLSAAGKAYKDLHDALHKVDPRFNPDFLYHEFGKVQDAVTTAVNRLQAEIVDRAEDLAERWEANQNSKSNDAAQQEPNTAAISQEQQRVRDIFDRARVKKGLTIEQIAQKAGPDTKTVRRVRNGEQVHIKNIKAIADFLEVDPAELLPRKSNMPGSSS